LPATPKNFIHRVGRVARAGRSGVAFSLVGGDDVAQILLMFAHISSLTVLFSNPV
jgi:superfamily II DNA/RNA helicase